MRSMDDLAALVAFFEARGGQMHGFRWKDWADFKSSAPSAAVGLQDQDLGVGDGVRTVFPLQKLYQSGPGRYLRPITKPVRGTVIVALAGVEVQEAIDWRLDHATGALTFATAPGKGAAVTAGFEFDVPVRFDTDRIAVSVASFQAGTMPEVPVIEVRT